VQASENLWGAAVLAVKTVAARGGLKVEKHRGLWGSLAVPSLDNIRI